MQVEAFAKTTYRQSEQSNRSVPTRMIESELDPVNDQHG
jgi:hypothetical protein